MMICSTLLSWLVLFASLSSCQGAVSLNEFFPYGPSNGDSALPPNDDSSTNEINLWPFVFPFVDNVETHLWVNNNGQISFGNAIRVYNPICGPVDLNTRMVAVFWTDVDTRHGGDVYYRQTTDRVLLQKASNEIIKRYSNMVGLNLKWLFVATWLNVASYKGPKPKRDTFQLILATDGTLSFALMYYNKLEWTNGNGGHAKVGFDAGDKAHFFKIDGSCTCEIINMTERSNMDQPGKFVFRIDNFNISTSLCDNSTYENGKQKLKVTPSFVDTLGHVPVGFQGPCFPDHYVSITCTFEDFEKGHTSVNGTLVTTPYGSPTVYCTAPYFYALGRINVNVTIKLDDWLTKKYSAFLSVASLAPSVFVNISTKIAPEDPTNETILNVYDFLWNEGAAVLENATLIDIKMIWYDPDAEILADLVTLAGKSQLNTGHAFVKLGDWTIPDEVKEALSRSFVVFSVGPSEAEDTMESVKSGYRMFSELLVAKAAILTLAPSERDYDIIEAPAKELPPCPCTETQARTDLNFRKDGESLSSISTFHPGGVSSYRNSAPVASLKAGQQCVYDENGNILTGPPGGGTATFASPDYSSILHYYHDIIPWYIHCAWELTSCQHYYEKRPSQDCSGYVPPRPSIANGDPHIVTFDRFQYTFNGAGEFLMVDDGVPGTFAMQARMEQFGKTKASVFTAFVMRQGRTVVQVQKSQVATVDILVDGYPVQFDDPGLVSQTFNREATVIALNDDLSLVSVSLSSGFSFLFATAEGAMAVTASASRSNRGKLRGLLGDFDGKPENDLKMPNGTVLSPNASLSEIHWQFGIKWMISESESLFYYSTGMSYGIYSRPDFKPSFKEPDLNRLPEAVKQVCGNSADCHFDYIATGGDLAFANQTRLTEKVFNETIEMIEQIVLKCHDIGRPEKGYAMFTNGLLLGSRVSFYCEADLLLNGSSHLVCFEDGRSNTFWNGTLPTCVKLACPPIYNIPDGNVLLTSHEYLPGSTASFICDSGYGLVGARSLTCSGTNLATITWGGIIPKCVPLKCPSVQPLEHGYTKLTNEFFQGSTLLFTCKTGYELVGNSAITCNGSDFASMKWSGDSPACVRLACDSVSSDLKDGVVRNNNSFVKGSIVDFKCNAGYELDGPAWIVCRGDSLSTMEWSSKPPACVQVTRKKRTNAGPSNTATDSKSSIYFSFVNIATIFLVVLIVDCHYL